MRDTARFFLAAGLVGLAACTESSVPEADLPSAPGVLAAPPVAGPCSFRDARSFAGNYFSLRADKNTANDLLRNAESAATGSQARNDFFFQLFQLIESARNAGNTASFADGAKLVLEADDCGAFTFSHPGDLQNVLTEALTDGAFAYRNGTEGFVATEDGGSALFTANWNTWIGGRSMVIGAQLPPFGFGEQVVTSFGYRWLLLYDDGTPGPSGNDDIASVELCDESADEQPQYRVGRIKVTGAQTVLQAEGANILGFCDGPSSSSSFLGRALQRVVGFFTPTPLQAGILAPPGMAGGIGELSDFIGADAVAVGLTFVVQPSSGPVSQPFLVKVKAAGAGGTPLENVAITVSIAGNQGTPAGATLSPNPLSACGEPDAGTPSLIVNTDENGISAFCVNVNKPGGYQLAASSSLAGYQTATALSISPFNRTP